MSRIVRNAGRIIAPSLPTRNRERATPPMPPSPRAADSFTAAPPAPASVDPSFLPPGFDMNAAVAGMRRLLEAQGVSADALKPGTVSHTMMSDFDGTLGRSGSIPVFLRAKADVLDAQGNVVMKAGDFFKDDKGNDLMIHGLTGADVSKDLASLQAKFPSLPWSNVTQDWSAFDDRALALKTPLEDNLMRRIDEAPKGTGLLVITNRTSQDVAGGMRENVLRATKGKLAMVGVLTTGAPDVQKALGIDSPALSDGQRKAITQMVAITMLGGTASVKSHEYFDDSVSNDAPAIASLGAKFPELDTRVFVAQHTLNGHSVPHLVAKSDGRGGFTDPRDGSAWTPAKIDAFGKSDPQPLLPRLTPSAVIWS
jgi:hypothetical protein